MTETVALGRRRAAARGLGAGMLCLALLAALAERGLAAGPARASFVEDAAQLSARYRADLEELAKWCDAEGLAAQAEQTRRWLHPHDPFKLYVAVLPKEVGASTRPAADASPQVIEWQNRLTKLRQVQADALFDLARRAVVGHHPSLAMDLVLSAIHENPDHSACRRLLGYQPYRGEWCTADEVQKLRSGNVWHERFGWLPRANVTRYERGERNIGGSRWVSAEEDARLHANVVNGWDIETDHYIVRTNHSIEAGVQLGVRLEQLYRVWKQLFVRYYMSEQQVADLFAGRDRGRPGATKHLVVYFRNRDEYVQSLRAAIPNIGISVGVYVENTRRAYFFAGEGADDRTMVHEATHQLFQESRKVAPAVGKDANVWIIEGIAMYMETLHEENGFHVLGGWDDVRVQDARYRLLKDKFYVPLADFTALNTERLQGDPRIRTLYTQAAGLAHFLVHYDGGRYRDALVDYLGTVYSGRDTPGLLARLTGTSLAELDQQYRAYMEAGPNVPQAAAATAAGN